MTVRMRIPFRPAEWSYKALFTEEEVHTYGWVDGYGAEGNRLYVNPGGGFSHLPLRLDCPLEITILNLQST